MGRVGARVSAAALSCALLLALDVAPQTVVAAAKPAKVAAAASHSPKLRLGRANPARELGPERAHGKPKPARPPSGRLRTAVSAPWTALGPQPISSVDTYGASSGRVTSIAFDPTTSQIVYAGTAGGGVWKTTNGGLTWSPMSDNQATLGIGAVAVDPHQPLVVYAGTGEGNRCADCLSSDGLLQSRDGGVTWTLLGSPLSGHYVNAIVVDRTNSNHVVVASSAGLFDSFDATFWNANTSFAALSTTSEPRVDSLFQDASSPNVWWASVSERCLADGFIARSTDNGSTWSVVRRMSTFAGMPQAKRIAMAGGPGGVLYGQVASCGVGAWGDGQFAGILKSTDSGAHWTLIRSASGLIDPFSLGGGFYQGWYDNVVAVDPTNVNHVVFGGVTVLATRDGGASFVDVARPYSNGPVHPDTHALVFTGAPDTLYTGNDGGIWQSSNLGNSWTNLNSTLAITTFYGGAAADSTHLVAGSQDDGTVATYPGGSAAPAWSEEEDGDGTLAQIVPGTSIYYGAQPGGVIFEGDYTTPGVFRLASPCDNNSATPACNDPASFVAPFAVDPGSTASATTLYVGSNRVWRSTTGGTPAGSAGWTAISPDLTTGLNVFTTPDTLSAIAVGPNGTVVTGSWGGALYESTNANSANPTWTQIQYNGFPYFDPTRYAGRPWITSIAIAPNGEIYIATGSLGGGVFLGKPPILLNQLFWTALGSPSGTFVDSVAADPGNPQIVYAGTDAGAFQCYLCDPFNLPVSNWQPLGSGLPNSPIDQITVAADKNEIVAFTHGRGAWIMPNPNAQSVFFHPSPLDFGSVYPGSHPPPLEVIASTPMSTPNVNWGAATITGTNASDFAITSDGCVGSGTYCGIYVGFTASAAGTRTATLNLVDDAAGSPQSVPLTAYVTPANVSFSSNPVNLGATTVGTTSSPVTLTISSTGTGPLTFGTLSVGETDGQNVAIVGGSDHCSGQSVGPGGSCSVQLTMSPPYAKGVSATLTVPDNAGFGTQYVSITGVSNGAWVGVPPALIDFGGVNVGVASMPQQVLRTNFGNQDLIVTAVSITGANASNFNIISQNCTTGPVHPGQSCDVQVTFTADALASRTATLSFTDNGFNERATTLNGHGVNTSATVNFSSIEYNTVAIGGFGAADVLMHNNGPDALTVEGFAVTGPNASDFTFGFSTCLLPLTLSNGGGCDFIMDFRPAAQGTPSRSGTLTIYDSTGSHVITLHGTASGPSFVFSANPLDFGTATAGSPVTRSQTITNGGDAAFTVNAISNGCCFNDYTVATDGCTGVSIAPGASCSLTFKFDPWGSGDRSDFIRVFANSYAINATFNVTATGVAPSPSSPVTVFPDTGVMHTSAPTTVTVTNAGPAAWIVGTLTTGSVDFGIVGGTDLCSGTTVNPGGSCTVQVVFTPKNTSMRFAGLTGSGNYHFGVAQLSGNGISPYANPPRAVAFGSIEVGAAHAVDIPVTNSGTTTLHVTGATFTSGTAFSLTSQTCQSVAPQGQCSLTVTFAPKTAGPISDTMTVVDDEVTPPSISLTGTGVAAAPCSGASIVSSPSVPASPGTQVTFTASAVGCPRPMFDFWLTPPGGSAVETQTYSAQSWWVWDTSGLPAGSYLVTVRVRDFLSSAVQEASAAITFRIVSPACASATVTADHPGPQAAGTRVTFTVARPGCADPASYQFWVIGNGMPWSLVQSYSTTATWTVDYSLLKGVGTYSIDVWVKEPGSTNQYDTFGLASFVVAGCTSAAITPNAANSVFTVSAAGPACATPEYQYWIFSVKTGWFIAKPWTTTSTFDPSTLTLSAGTYSLDVWVRQQAPSSSPAHYETWALSTIVIPGGGCGGATLAPSISSPAAVGASVKFTATAGSCSSPQYEYWLFPGTGGGWQLLQGYRSAATYNLDSSALHLNAGTYSVVAWVRQPGTPSTAYDAYGLYSFTFGGDDSVALNSDFHSPQPLGRTVTFTAVPSGLAATSSEYEFWGLAQGGSWVLLQSWSSDPSLKLETLYDPYGALAVVVWVRPAGTSPPGGYETYDLVSYALTG